MTSMRSLMPDADSFTHGSQRAPARRFNGSAVSTTSENLIEEVPVSLEWNGERHVVMMATPTDLEAFAIGFSITEGIVGSAAQILAVDVAPTANGVGILIRIPQQLPRMVAERSQPGTSSCGLCGMRDMQAVMRAPESVRCERTFSPSAIFRAMRDLPGFQKIGAQTGAAHAAGFALPTGEIVEVCEDAGRHNALDKLVGKLSMGRIEPASGFLVLTSRASLEMVKKAATAGFPMLCAISAATGLAVRMAEETGLTLVTFARGEQFVCFAHAERIGGGTDGGTNDA